MSSRPQGQGQGRVQNHMDAAMRDTTRTRAANWLTRHRKPVVSGNKFMNWAKTNKSRDWFLALANAVSDRDATQGKMLVKLYIFVLEYMPQGLTGEYAHIRGDDVMAYLLPESNSEIAISRHRHSKDAELALISLEAWKKKGGSWSEALNAAADSGHPIDIDADGSEPHPWKAPALFSPAGLLALLVIAHPDEKILNWVGRLGIGWMLQERDTLEVRDGFWKGITASNLEKCFTPEKARPKNTTLLADYKQLFGCFTAARADMRPDLPHWTSITLDQEPMDLGDMSSVGGNGTPARTLREHLYPSTEAKPLRRLEQWLISNVASNSLPAGLLAQWCQDWAAKIGQAESYEAQSIHRSLFEQSLRRLESISTASEAVGVATGVGIHVIEAYLLLDKGDLVLKAPADLEDPDGKREINNKIQSYQFYKDTAAQLCRLVSSKHARDLAARIATQQCQYFFSILKQPALHKLWNEVILFDTGRIQAILQRHDEAQQRRAKMELHDNLLRDDMIKSLHLTTWQMRNLVLPCELSEVLTEQQLRVIDPRPESSETEFLDLSKALPVTPRRDPSPSEDPKMRETFSQLFGDICHSDNGDVHENGDHDVHQNGDDIHQNGDDVHQNSDHVHQNGTCHDADAPGGASSSRQPSRQLSRGPSQKTPEISRKTPVGHSASTPAESGFNLFAGKTYVPAKRCADGNVKPASRLWGLSRDDLREELSTVRQGLTDEISHQISRDLDRVRKEDRQALTQEISHRISRELDRVRKEDRKAMQEELSGQLRKQLSHMVQIRDDVKTAHQKELQQMRDDVKTAHQRELQQMRDDIKTAQQKELQAVQAKLEEIDGSYMKLRDMTAGLAEEFSTAEDDKGQGDKGQAPKWRQSVDQQLQQVKDHLQSIHNSVETAVKTAAETAVDKEPELGQDGYLERNCPAPDGCEQRDYESKLIRASWFYINILSLPEEGFGADEEALQATTMEFPDIRQVDIGTALEHIHMQVYHKPFNS